MTQAAITRPGFDVLAYVSLQAATPVPLSLKFQYNEKRAQATLCLLQSSTILEGFDGAETFIILQYDAENLVPGAVSLRPMGFHQALSGIARSTRPDIRRLSFKLKRCCPTWRPLTASLAPKPGFVDRFQHLVTLANATELHIVFDYSWLPPQCLATFQQLVAQPEQLSGYPVHRYYSQCFKREDVFSSHLVAPVDAALASDATTEDEEQPPPYIAASNKRQASTSAPSSPPTRKRTVLPQSNPAHIHPSKAEKGSVTTTALDVQQAVHGAVLHILPGILNTVLPGLVQNAVSKYLPSALEDVLPNLLSAPLSPSSQSASSQTSTRVPKALSALGTVLTKRVVLGLKQELEDVHNQTLSHADDLRSTADAQFQEDLEELRLELVQAQEELVNDLHRIGDDTLTEFKERCEAEGEEAGDRLSRRIFTVYDRLSDKVDPLLEGQGELATWKRGLLEQKDELLKRKSKLVEDERKALAREMALLGRESEGPEIDRDRVDRVTNESEKRHMCRARCIERGVRARSAPV
ncbi:uncharacterized protein K460DRAFT_371283 [Cucurbitaria berberidis CBS 394.84]|uniref:Uncharacterized protein n=1 Tax=Cucurbitaria berberidis CBS 394.84 TaxID=1168544 RepID=A0A9P4G6R6_9PLEO|nr:uncharacterized protein K460DRAFT_371283 [Cucurbitaria berberidis CBS 394.84]KAF1840063.1 hypothetical protein K460DRAFT_371283 [Cucurbitaria berberidis CBS 394.84]